MLELYPFITFWLECVATTSFNVWFYRCVILTFCNSHFQLYENFNYKFYQLISKFLNVKSHKKVSLPDRVNSIMSYFIFFQLLDIDLISWFLMRFDIVVVPISCWQCKFLIWIFSFFLIIFGKLFFNKKIFLTKHNLT
jgi:hypothetical protein